MDLAIHTATHSTVDETIQEPAQRDTGGWQIFGASSGPMPCSAQQLMDGGNNSQSVAHTPDVLVAAQGQPSAAPTISQTSVNVTRKALPERRGKRARLAELLGLVSVTSAAGKSPRVGGDAGFAARDSLDKIPSVMMSPRHKSSPRKQPHGALQALLSLQPPLPVASAQTKVLMTDTDQQPLPAHGFDGAVFEERKQVPSASSVSSDEGEHTACSSQHSEASYYELCGIPARTSDVCPCHHEQCCCKRQVAHTPTPGGPQTPTLTPSSISVASSRDEGNCLVHSVPSGEFMNTEHLLYGQLEKDNEEQTSRSLDESAVQLQGLEFSRTGNSSALLAHDIFELASTMTKRLMLEGWNRQALDRKHNNMLARQFREYNADLRNRKQILFSHWSWHVQDRMHVHTLSHLSAQEMCSRHSQSRMTKRSILHFWSLNVKKAVHSEDDNANKLDIFAHATSLCESITRRMTKRLVFECWTRHTSVVIWTHGRLRLAAHKSRMISLRGIWVKLTHTVEQRCLKRATLARAVRKGEILLLRRIWMALIAYIIDTQLQEVFDADFICSMWPVLDLPALPPSRLRLEQTPHHLSGWQHNLGPGRVSADRCNPEDAESCKRALFDDMAAEGADAGVKSFKENENATGERFVKDTSEVGSLLRRHILLSRSQETVISKLRDRLDSQASHFQQEMFTTQAELARLRAQSLADAHSLKTLQKKMLEDSVALRQHEQRECQLRLQLEQLREHAKR